MMEGREQGVGTRDLAGGATAGAPSSAPAAEDRESADRDIAAREPAATREGTPASAASSEVRAADADERDRSTTGAPAPAGTTEGATTTADMATQDTTDSAALLPHDENTTFQRRWEEIQTGFVDEPRRAVEQADELVAELMKRLAEGFAAERERLEQQWGRGEDISTEDLRVALQRYRAFFQRLLSA